MFLKLIVLLLFIIVTLLCFSLVNRQKIQKKENTFINKQTDPEEMKPCDTCGTFVTITTPNCGREECPY